MLDERAQCEQDKEQEMNKKEREMQEWMQSMIADKAQRAAQHEKDIKARAQREQEREQEMNKKERELQELLRGMMADRAQREAEYEESINKKERDIDTTQELLHELRESHARLLRLDKCRAAERHRSLWSRFFGPPLNCEH